MKISPEVVGAIVGFMAVSNVLSAFQLQCLENETARTVNKIELLLGGAGLVFGLGVVYYKSLALIDVALGVLLVQSILALMSQSPEEDCEKGAMINVVNVLVLLGTIGALLMKFGPKRIRM